MDLNFEFYFLYFLNLLLGVLQSHKEAQEPTTQIKQLLNNNYLSHIDQHCKNYKKKQEIFASLIQLLGSKLLKS